MSKRKAIDFEGRDWTEVDTSLTGSDPRWNFFLRTPKDRDGDIKTTNRYLAKCTMCQDTMEGRLDRMAEHFLGKCRIASLQQQNQYRTAIEIAKKSTEEVPATVNSKSTNFYTKKRVSKTEQENYHDLVTSALVTGNISPRFVGNEAFIDAQNFLIRITGVAFKPPTESPLYAGLAPHQTEQAC